MAGENNFPVKTLLALATFAGLLVAFRRFEDPAKGLSPTIFADATHLDLLRHAPAPAVAEKPPTVQPLNGIQKPQTNLELKALPAISPYLIDDEGSLNPFFAALHGLTLPAEGTKQEVITILHYGDSPTTADLITGDVRTLLQARFGDAGYGFLLAGRPWAWYGHRGVEMTDKGWQISTAVGKGREEIYGLGGASFEGTEASTHITLKDQTQTAVDIAFLARPHGGMVSVLANGVAVESFSTAADAPHPAWHTAKLPAGTKTVDLKLSSGPARLFGESFLTGHRGVLYDSLGLNGASTTVLSNGFNAGAWTAALEHERPALVVINYGTNESGYGAWVDKMYEPSLRTAITRIRTALPGVPVLVMSPMDRGLRSGVDQIVSYDTIPRILAIQRRVAAEMHCGFFDTFHAMGGEGTMSRWYNGHPRLVAGDLIHPTPQGASIVAQLFVKDLMLGYERYLRQLAAQPSSTQSPNPPSPVTEEPAKMKEKPSVDPASNAVAQPAAPTPSTEAPKA